MCRKMYNLSCKGVLNIEMNSTPYTLNSMAHVSHCKFLKHEFTLFRKFNFKFSDIGSIAGIRSRRPTGSTDTVHKLHQALMFDDETHSDNESDKVDLTPKIPSQIFNTVLYQRARRKNYELFLSRFKKNNSQQDKPKTELSAAVESILKDSGLIPAKEDKDDCEKEKKIISYPFAIQTKTNIPLDEQNVMAIKERLKKLSSVHYSQYAEDDQDSVDYDLEMFRNSGYGTPKPEVPASKIPCGGCGAILHCQDTGVPGYIPSEIFQGATTRELRSLICQRCHFLKDYKIALGVNISKEQYSKLLSEIKEKVALVILIVDLLDFPVSIWPGLVDIIGKNRPICVVGNKVDLIPKDKRGYVDRIKQSLAKSLKDVGLDTGKNIKHICLVSAKTGFGIEQLITKIQNSWGMKGDVYLVGCTNVGKSSLFNALIQSDFCKAQAVDIIQRATISPWPGTTLNLLKFPILSPTGKRLFERTKRLISNSEEEHEEAKLRQLQFQKTKNWQYATLMSHVGFTFYNPDAFRNREDNFSMNLSMTADSNDDAKVFNPKNQEFADSKWCYDTPGSVQPNQILDLLTLEELKLTLSKEIIKPKTYAIKPNYTFFLAGLGRIDVKAIDRGHTIRFTVFSSPYLPVSVVPTHEADKFYKENLGTDVLGVPFGDHDRLKDFPPLISKEFQVKGVGWGESCADIILSSAGWVSITCGHAKFKLIAYTPGEKGCVLRQPALLPFSVELRGQRIKYTPCFKNDFVPLY